jgi:F-type H+-transporting ATPase subunit alpha
VPTSPQDRLDDWLRDARKRVETAALSPSAEEIGRVERAADGIALVSGLPRVRLDELVRFERGQVGIAIALDRDAVGCVLLDGAEGIEAGDSVRGFRWGRPCSAALSIRSAARSTMRAR